MSLHKRSLGGRMVGLLYQLSPDAFSLAQPLFDSETRLAVAAALAGKVPAELYVDDPEKPQAAILILWNHRIYLAGTPGNDAFCLAFSALLRERYTPQEGAERPSLRPLDYTPSSWENRLASLFADAEESLRAERQYYRFDLSKPVPLPTLPEGFVLRAIDEALLAQSSLGNYEALVEEIHSEAPSVAAFLQQRFGYCVLSGQDLVGWCLSEYNHGNHCEVGIETHPAFLRRGLATATAQAVMAHAQAEGFKTIGWHCWKSNLPSSGLARKLGFEHVEDYPVWYCRF